MLDNLICLQKQVKNLGKQLYRFIICIFCLILAGTNTDFGFGWGGAVAYVGGTSVLSLNLLISAIAGAQHLYSTASTDLSGNLIGTSIGSFLLAFAGFGVMLVFQIILSIKVARSYGKGTGYVWGLILIPEIFYMILGFGSAQYLGRNQPSLKQRQNLNGQDQYRYVEEMQTTDKER